MTTMEDMKEALAVYRKRAQIETFFRPEGTRPEESRVRDGAVACEQSATAVRVAAGIMLGISVGGVLGGVCERDAVAATVAPSRPM